MLSNNNFKNNLFFSNSNVLLSIFSNKWFKGYKLFRSFFLHLQNQQQSGLQNKQFSDLLSVNCLATLLNNKNISTSQEKDLKSISKYYY